VHDRDVAVAPDEPVGRGLLPLLSTLHRLRQRPGWHRGRMPRNRYAARPPLYGMVMVLLAMAIVAVTAYFHLGWWSIIGHAIAAVIAVAGFAVAFRDLS
jgi:hypothetical protein